VALLLKKAGITNVRALVGGYEEWAKRGNPIEKGAEALLVNAAFVRWSMPPDS